MPPFINQSGSRGPPIPLRDMLEKINKLRAKVIQRTAKPAQLMQLQESAEDLADDYDIEILWFESYAALYGAFHGSFQFSQGSKLFRG